MTRHGLDRLEEPQGERTVTFYRERGRRGYGVLGCSWEDERRGTLITEEAARKFAAGRRAAFRVEDGR